VNTGTTLVARALTRFCVAIENPTPQLLKPDRLCWLDGTAEEDAEKRDSCHSERRLCSKNLPLSFVLIEDGFFASPRMTTKWGFLQKDDVERLRNHATGNSMIVGLGVDIAEIDRIEAAIARRGNAFLERVFTPSEIAYCQRHRSQAERFAGRFAAKEAAMKALGTGWRRGVRWVDIEVVREPSGKPTLVFYGATRILAERLGVKHVTVSITHAGNTAYAQVIFED
jgi:holo-[acyl-carrier protein] synthase